MSCEWIRTGKNSCHLGCSEAMWATGSGSSFCSSRGEHVLNVWVWLSLIRERGERKLKCHSLYVTYSLWKSLSPTSEGLLGCRVTEDGPLVVVSSGEDLLPDTWSWMTCFPESMSPDVPARKGTDPTTHGGFSITWCASFPFRTVQWTVSQRN